MDGGLYDAIYTIIMVNKDFQYNYGCFVAQGHAAKFTNIRHHIYDNNRICCEPVFGRSSKVFSKDKAN